MQTKFKVVLVIDDDPIQAELHTIFLEEAGYETMYAENGAAALDILKHVDIDISVILSDVLMPEMDGYELCSILKKDEALKEIPFIFVSALIDIDEKLKGYAAGGDDYVSKPIMAKELLEKVHKCVAMRDQTFQIKQQLQDSYQTAMQAMTYSSDLGRLLEFNNSTQNINTFDELSQNLFQIMESFGLDSTLYILTPSENISFSSEGSVSPLEKNVIELARQKDRIWSFGARTIINYKDFSFLIKNMPVDDPERHGMLKDTLGSLCNTIESRITILLFSDSNKHKAEILESVREALGQATDAFSDIQKQNLKAIQEMTDQLDHAIINLGLSDHQENLIRDIAVNCYEKVDSIFDESMELNDSFRHLEKRLTKIFIDL